MTRNALNPGRVPPRAGWDLGLHGPFFASAARHPDRPALEAGGRRWSYQQLSSVAASISAVLMPEASDEPGLVGVFGQRSLPAYAGILGALAAGRGYVPLNRSFPLERTRAMLERAGCRTLVVDAASAGQLDGLLPSATGSWRLIVDLPDVRAFSERWPAHRFYAFGQLAFAPAGWTPRRAAPDAVAYLLFTSGSTGTPKGVAVTHANASHFVAVASERYHVTEDDRFSQMFDTTFDLSIFDLFVAWSGGACVCAPSEHLRLNPDAFVREHALTVWFSVPSVGGIMNRLGMLKRGRYPALRWSLFCGEALPVGLAEAWAAAAPNSIVENLYGPTEATVACCVYRWDPERSAAASSNGIVPIGDPLPGTMAAVVDDSLREVAPGEPGELVLAGPQIAPGYWDDADATARAFVVRREDGRRYYRTGDRVRRPAPGGPMTFIGRLDDQVKVLGYRVELGEVEARLRELPGVAAAAAVAWPVTSSGAAGIVAFVAGSNLDGEDVRGALQAHLPAYACPRSVRVMPDLPKNGNGKIDRRALLQSLRDASAYC